MKLFKGIILGIASSTVLVLSHKNFTKISHCENQEYKKVALCILNPDGNNTANGKVLFSQSTYDGPTKIKAEFKCLKKNALHGFHVHIFGDLSEGCVTAGPHYNPFGKFHGGPEDSERHVGDLGNVTSDSEGNAVYQAENNLIRLSGNYSIIGRSCVLHADQDDLGRGNFNDSKTTGHSGARIACGVIALADEKKYNF